MIRMPGSLIARSQVYVWDDGLRFEDDSVVVNADVGGVELFGERGLRCKPAP